MDFVKEDKKRVLIKILQGVTYGKKNKHDLVRELSLLLGKKLSYLRTFTA